MGESTTMAHNQVVPQAGDDWASTSSEKTQSPKSPGGHESVYKAPQLTYPRVVQNQDIFRRLLSRSGHLAMDRGHLRYFGPTSNLHIFCSEEDDSNQTPISPLEQQAMQTIGELSLDTHSYLLDLFWENYNTVVEIVPRAQFLDSYQRGNADYYSVFLHCIILSLGIRFADKSRPDVSQLMVSAYESKLQVAAKLLVDVSLERGGISAIQGFLLLGDLECGCGRDIVGWMYAGIANRLFFEMGLNVDGNMLGLADQDIEARRKVALACIIIDKYWALFLGRPTTVKNADLTLANLSKSFGRLHHEGLPHQAKSIQQLVYGALSDLMEIIGQIADTNAQRTTSETCPVIAAISFLDGELNRWLRDLPDALKWKTSNINTAPHSFFLMHQQYHVARILLHEPFILYPKDQQNPPTQQVLQCYLENAIAISRIFRRTSRRFLTSRSFITAMQHAGVAASALITSLAFVTEAQDRSNVIDHLLSMTTVLQDLGQTYRPAVRMHSVVLEVLRQTGWDNKPQQVDADYKLGETCSGGPSGRRESSARNRSELRTTNKRRMTDDPQIATSGCLRDSEGILNDRDLPDISSTITPFWSNAPDPTSLCDESSAIPSMIDGLRYPQKNRPSEVAAQQQKQKGTLTEQFQPLSENWEQIMVFSDGLEFQDPSLRL